MGLGAISLRPLVAARHVRVALVARTRMGPNRTVINKGLGRERIAHLSRSDIRTVGVRDLPATAGRGIRPDRVERSGSSMVVYRPGAPAGERNSAISPRTGRGGDSRDPIVGSNAGRNLAIGQSNPGGNPRGNPGDAIGRSSAAAAATPLSAPIESLPHPR